MAKIFSWDFETNGLWAEGFAGGALVLDENGAEVARFLARLPDSAVTHPWWTEIVPELGCTRLSQLANVPVTHQTYDEMLAAFARFYLEHKVGADVVVHMGYIVEVKILRDMFERGYIGEWDGPYPLYDVADFLKAAGEDPTSVDAYVAKHGLAIGDFEGGTHNPLYDSAVAAAVYRHLVG